ncbi:MAG TPA: hypothetical protein GX745_08490 [Clostridiales bacterium]|nr:hypothetical protein [Clostridiales bacterium]
METVSKEYCVSNHKNVDERFGRDLERIRATEELTRKLSDLTIEMQQMIKRHDDEILKHDNRISALEKRPGLLLDKIISAVISFLVGGAGGIVLTKIMGG